jgi:ABC-type transporter Mla subunit MlaD
MSDPRNLTLEQINRLTEAVANLMESHAAQGRAITRLLEQISTRLAAIEGTLVALDKSVRDLSG